MVWSSPEHVHSRMTATDTRPRAWIGISGYNYRNWRGNFYPRDLAVREWLGFASRQFNSIELNGTFYSLKTPAVYRRWVEATPEGFIFAIKGSRFITHNLKLARAETALANFFASGILALGERTGPFLWQLPATYGFNYQRTEEFLRLLPQSSVAAEALALEHNPGQVPQAEVTAAASVPYRHALEPRHPSWFTPACYDLLARHGVALVSADTAGKFPQGDVATADFVYLRLHGSRQLYASRYEDHELAFWSERMAQWVPIDQSRQRDAYVYFDNDAHGHAPHDALRLAERARAMGFEVGREPADIQGRI